MSAKKGFGTQFKYCTTQSGTYVLLPGVTKVSPYKIKAEHVDGTSMDSPGSYREKIPTFLDAGQCVVDYNFDDTKAAQTDLIALAGTVIFFEVVFPGAVKKVTGSGILSPGGPDAPFDNKMGAQLSVEITGAVALAAAS